MLKMLFLAAATADQPQLAIPEEIRLIDQELRKAEYRAQVQIAQQWAVRAGDLPELLMRHRPNIVHFSGHGDWHNQILLVGADGRSEPLPELLLAQLFIRHADTIRCVVLNACYSGGQAEAIAAQIDCVIGMGDGIPEAAAINFATAFYQALAYGESVAHAYATGCWQIDVAQSANSGLVRLLGKADPAHVRFVDPNEAPAQLRQVATSPHTVVTDAAYIQGNVNVRGEFVAHDKIIHGDNVHGDKVLGDKVGGDKVGADKVGADKVGGDKVGADKVGGDKVGADKNTAGNISHSTGVSIGRKAQAHVTIAQALAPLVQAAKEAPLAQRPAAIAKVHQLEAEALKGTNADDAYMGSLLQDLVDLLPDVAGAVTSVFASPLLAGVIGPVTKFVLKRIEALRPKL